MTVDRHNGTPCWVDLATPDIDAATAFYAAVFGWTFEDQGADYGGYRMARAGDAVVAGIGPKPEGNPMPAAWTVYLQTDDLDATVDAWEAAGGGVMLTHDIAVHGRMAVCTDPSGAVVGLWQAAGHAGFAAMGGHGEPGWFEVNTPDAPAVRDFFAGLFGLEHQKMDGMEYFMLHAGGRPRYGVLQMTDEWAGIPPHWMPYFGVADADAAAEAIRAAGGAVKHGPFDSPFGRMTVAADPTGAVFMTFQQNPGA